MEQMFPRSFDSLAAVYEFAEKIMLDGEIPDAARFPVQLALEELFVNMTKYNPDVSTDISVAVDTDPDSGVAVRMIDAGGVEFDVTQPRDVDIDAPLEDRTPGGLGLHLIQTLVSDLNYVYNDGTGTVTFTKKSGT